MRTRKRNAQSQTVYGEKTLPAVTVDYKPGRHTDLVESRRLATDFFRAVDGPSDSGSSPSVPPDAESTASVADLFDEQNWGLDDLVDPGAGNAARTASKRALREYRVSRDLPPLASVAEFIVLARVGMHNEVELRASLAAVQADVVRAQSNFDTVQTALQAEVTRAQEACRSAVSQEEISLTQLRDSERRLEAVTTQL